MCLIVAMSRMFDDAPLIIAANREEAYARGGTAIDWQHGPVPYLAGIDPTAGGTWLGINIHRLLVAVTNRPKTDVPVQPRSRGLLVTDLLARRSARDAADHATKEIASGRYRGCNILCADDDGLWIIHGGDWLRVRSLAPGIHIMTNGDVNDVFDERVRMISESLQRDPPRTSGEALTQLQQLTSRTSPPTPICLNGHDRGTVASTLVAMGSRPRRGRLLHAAGPPDRTAYADRTALLWELEGLAEERR